MMDTMYWACAELLTLAAQLPTARDLPPADVLQRRLSTLLQDMEKRGIEGGIPKRDLDEAKYAIVAFLDEQLFRASWSGRQQWMLEPLQFVLFNENTAGEGFFTRLDALEREPSRVHVLEIYYLCLSLGFQGKYAVRSGDGLASIQEKLASLLDRQLPGGAISPHGTPSEGRRGRSRRSVPVIALGGALVGVAIATFVVLKLMLGSAASDATAPMQRTAQAPASAARPSTGPR